jgi:anti-anti-sigma factor
MQFGIQVTKPLGVSEKEAKNSDQIFKLYLNGNFVVEIVEEFTTLTNVLFAGGMRRLAIDLAELKYIDSTGIGVLINVTKLLRSKSGDMVFLNVNSKIMEVFSLVKLQEFIPCFKSEKQMLEHLSSIHS